MLKCTIHKEGKYQALVAIDILEQLKISLASKMFIKDKFQLLQRGLQLKLEK